MPSVPSSASVTPAAAAPTTRIELCVVAISATAFISHAGGTTLGISELRAGWSNAISAPRANEAA